MTRTPQVSIVCLLAGALLLLGCSEGSPPDASAPDEEPTSTASPSRPGPASGGKDSNGTFAVGTRKLFLTCAGTGRPTVVLEAGDAVSSGVMYQALEPRLSPSVRVCAYDRANTGMSDSGAPTPRRSAQVLEDLHGLLEAADVPAPYVLVGHSAP
jgi:hypothetical protein